MQVRGWRAQNSCECRLVGRCSFSVRLDDSLTILRVIAKGCSYHSSESFLRPLAPCRILSEQIMPDPFGRSPHYAGDY